MKNLWMLGLVALAGCQQVQPSKTGKQPTRAWYEGKPCDNLPDGGYSCTKQIAEVEGAGGLDIPRDDGIPQQLITSSAPIVSRKTSDKIPKGAGDGDAIVIYPLPCSKGDIEIEVTNGTWCLEQKKPKENKKHDVTCPKCGD